MSEDDLYKRAEQRADEKIGFYKHLSSFVIVNVILIAINLLTFNGNWWFYWVTVFWGIGLLTHFLRVFVFNGKFEGNREKMIEKEMEKMKK
jgi:hypothetical protein